MVARRGTQNASQRTGFTEARASANSRKSSARQDGEIGVVNADGATFANSSIAASRVQEAPDLEVLRAAAR